ncbi:hypothetical protein K4K61_003388 [Colletotrichum sp. SAR11_59]|nr:hypothetical protein K4K61_003388 [Colletotrichum sp. SAR11_59]
MEVFLNNVPQQLTDRTLEKQLEPYYRLGGEATARFGKKMIILKFRSGVKAEMAYSSVYELIHSSPGTITLVLSEPPKFYRPGIGLDERLSRLTLAKPSFHQKKSIRCTNLPGAPPNFNCAGECLVYQLSAMDANLDDKMMALQNRGLLNIAHFHMAYDGSPAPETVDYQRSWEIFYKCLTHLGTETVLPFRVLFFMQSLFCDEDGTDLWFNPKIDYQEVFQRYKAVLNRGIQVAGRIYQFLGFSHSSLRSHAAWFMAPFVDGNGDMQLYHNIIKALGDFEHIQVPAKCAARIGQAFSETPAFISLNDCDIHVRDIPDIKSCLGGDERVFSDGVGTISKEALELIWPRLPRGSLIPTCLQIRWGGVKGMLSLDSRLPGRVMCIRRESMEKFPSRDTENLEICDGASKPLKMVLNRQMIKIMEDLGVRNEFFLRLQKVELDRLRAVTADAYNTGTFLHVQGIGLNFFLPTFIKSLDRYELRLLKHKARIPVPNGVTVFGVMDETGFLREGEVYVAYDTYRRPGRTSVDGSLRDGPVLVTRSPALHPGDIQLARSRTPPPGHPLRDLRNCIAFSQSGKRDLPSQLSGGDLDGDLYNVIWDRDAMPGVTYNAADYPRVTPAALGRAVQREDMANWFVDFMQSDCLGLIATRHLVLSDQNPDGTLSDACLTLAGLHSTAVDFSKTGIPVDPREIPKAPRFRPDFLAPAPPARIFNRSEIEFLAPENPTDEDEEEVLPAHQYYKSEKILGVLYRNVDERQIWNEDMRRIVDRTGPSVWEQFAGLMHRKIYDYSSGRVTWKKRQVEARRLRDVLDLP